MAYFLPSYFQKRLLRYALARLDLIDTDAIDLDDLDISLGQRSVIELKNVGIQVDKLIEKLQLPSAVILKHAIIKQLRLTIPADLHVSGIDVLVDGVDIDVEIKEQGLEARQTSSTSSHKDVSDRSRLTSPSIHDPGGYSYGLTSEHVLPTSEDLAQSFLEAEPQQEKAQLEAALHSQSQYISESTASLDETGLGDPAGFSLPTFVADFFAGVASRLGVAIKNVQVVAGISLPSGESPMETVKLMFRLADISLFGSNTGKSMAGERRIELSGLEVLILSEPEAFSRHSVSSSPRLSKARSKASTTLGSDNFSQFESPDQPFSSSFPDQSLTSSRTPSDIDLSPVASRSSVAESDLNISTLAASQLFNLSRSNGSATRSYHSEQNDAQVERTGSSRYAAALEHSTDSLFDQASSPLEHDQDLGESKLFSHEEAASMYMSAVSHDPASSSMPGAWEAEQSVVDGHRHDEQSISRSGIAETLMVETAINPTDPSQTNSDSQHSDARSGFKSTDLSIEYPDLIAKRLLELDRFTVIIPIPNGAKADDRSQFEAPRLSHYDAGKARESIYHSVYDRRGASSVLRSTEKSSASTLFQSTYGKLSPQDFITTQKCDYTVNVGNLSCCVDVSIARILIQASSSIRNLLPATADDKDNNAVVRKSISSKAQVNSIAIKFCQSVPETDLSASGGNSVHCLLQLVISRISHQMVQNSSEVRQKLTVGAIEVGREEEKVLYFVDSMSIQNSIATSAIIRPDDFVMLHTDNRVDVQLKPVQIVLDLILVDDILSRGGGLDSLLDLGASATSTRTIRNSPRSEGPGVRPRSVHFDSPQKAKSKDTDTGSGLKIDLRLSGAFVDLVGSETSLQLRTTAIKVVLRSDKARVQIDKAALIGPILHGSHSAADINIRLDNTTFIYLNSPAEEDLERLLSLLTPSSDKYENEDDIMVPTLLRQRRKGGVLRLSVADVQVHVRGMTWQHHITRIGDELSKLSAVSKYLPEDDRPGVLTFALFNKIGVKLDMGRPFGILQLNAALFEGASITMPSLMAAQVSNISLKRDSSDIILSEVIPNSQDSVLMSPPMLMCRFIADEMEPTVRIKLSNTQVEYKVALVIALTELLDSLQKEMSVDNTNSQTSSSVEASQSSSEVSDLVRKVRFVVTIRNSSIGLNPTDLPSKGLFALSDAVFQYGRETKKEIANIRLDLRKASVLIINDIERIGHEATNADHRLYFEENDQVQDLTKAGYVPVGSISNASAAIIITEDKSTSSNLVDVEFRNNLFLLETCADSTQTLIQILSGLSPPSKPSPEVKYRTEIVSIQDMLSSFTGIAFVSEPGPELGLQASQITSTTSTTAQDEHDLEDEYSDEAEDDEDGYYGNDLYADDDEQVEVGMEDSYMSSNLAQSTMTGSVHVAPVNITAEDDHMADSVMAHSMLDFRTDHFTEKTSVGGTAHRWDSTRNTYELGNETVVQSSPLKVRVRDVHVIWNLFDGYDWQSTRDTISKAVEDIEAKALSKQSRRDSQRYSVQDDDESVIGDFLFNSIYIGIPANRDPRDLANAINHDIDDLASETGSYATGTTVTATPSGRIPTSRTRQKKLRLNRSKQHKMTFELKGISADVLVFPPGSGEVQSSIDARVKMLEIFDHVPTSTWKKFATYMNEAGEREIDTSMIHLELLNVKPMADLAASEFVLKLNILPLRLHVDQDALDFMTRFFEFKDDTIKVDTTPSVPPFIQRAEVNPIKLCLDYKPKRVDYAALRSGRTGEFKNFFTLDRSNMVLRRVILYGVSGFDRLGLMLNDIWSPDVQRNQLPGVLAGLAPIRSLVDVGSGVRDLVAVPIREYKKDGRIVRSIQKGALAFAKTTTTELVNLGAKLAIGTQTVLQGAEGMLTPRETEDDGETKEQISLYANQPLGIVQGLRGAYASLERDLLLAKDAIVAVPGEVMASGSAAEAAKAVLKQSPTIILRPAIGASKAVGQTLLGAGNSLDKRNRKRIEDKYKRR